MILGRVFESDEPDEGRDYLGIGYGADIDAIEIESGEGCEVCGRPMEKNQAWAVTPPHDHHTYYIVCSECCGKEDR